MKKFNLPLTTAISAAMLASAGCSSDRDWQTNSDTKLCVDQSGKRMTEDKCEQQPSGGGYMPYRWYYISRGGYIPYYNNPVDGGSYTPSAPVSSYLPAPVSAPEGAVTRGGFGGLSSGHGGEAGGEGGAGE
jgi:hypothetical protein